MDGQDGQDWIGFEDWGGCELEQKETLPILRLGASGPAILSTGGLTKMVHDVIQPCQQYMPRATNPRDSVVLAIVRGCPSSLTATSWF